MANDIDRRVLRVVASVCDFPLDSLTLGKRLLEDLGIDSLAIVELIMGLEAEFNIVIPDKEAQEFFTNSPVTIGDLGTLVQKRLSVKEQLLEERLGAQPSVLEVEEVAFTQFGPQVDRHKDGPLYDKIGLNREGFAEYRRRTDGMRCVLIPGGKTMLGTDSPSSFHDQQPAHSVHISAYFIDAEPVSNAAYARFLNAIDGVSDTTLADWCDVPNWDKRQRQFSLIRHSNRWKPVAGTERQPMILVSWYGANAYSLWANDVDWRLYSRDDSLDIHSKACYLPTEAQWEYAARGEETWQQVGIHEVIVSSDQQVAKHLVGSQYDANSLPVANVSTRLGMSPFGLHHMGGNVWQWCSDWYSPDFYMTQESQYDNPVNIMPSGIRSERGGSWVGPAKLATPWYRRGRPPLARGRCLGFRCVGAFPADETYK